MVKIEAYGEVNLTLSMTCNTNYRSLTMCNRVEHMQNLLWEFISLFA